MMFRSRDILSPTDTLLVAVEMYRKLGRRRSKEMYGMTVTSCLACCSGLRVAWAVAAWETRRVTRILYQDGEQQVHKLLLTITTILSLISKLHLSNVPPRAFVP